MKLVNPPDDLPHVCDLPSTSWWNRRKLGLVWGSWMQCEICGTKWRLTPWVYGDGGGWEWVRETEVREQFELLKKAERR